MIPSIPTTATAILNICIPLLSGLVINSNNLSGVSLICFKTAISSVLILYNMSKAFLHQQDLNAPFNEFSIFPHGISLHALYCMGINYAFENMTNVMNFFKFFSLRHRGTQRPQRTTPNYHTNRSHIISPLRVLCELRTSVRNLFQNSFVPL